MPINPIYQQLGLNLPQLMGNQQGYIQGLGSPGVGNSSDIFEMLKGFQGNQSSNEFLSKLKGFNSEVGGGVRGTLEGIMGGPFTGQAGTTMNEMLKTGGLVDTQGIGEAAHMRSNTALEEIFGQIKERAAMQGGLSGSGVTAQMGKAGAGLANESFAKMLEAGVGAGENAQNRRMGAMGQFLSGQGLAASAAQGLGGLEQGAQGMNLQALLGGGQLANQSDDQNLRALQSAGGLGQFMDNMGFQGQQAQAGAGQNFLNMLLSGGGGSFGSSGGPLSAQEMAHYIMRTGMATNQVAKHRENLLGGSGYSQPANPTSPYASPGGGGMNPGVGNFLGRMQELQGMPNLDAIGQVNPMKVGGHSRAQYMKKHGFNPGQSVFG